jgi:hypothetical protein
VRTKEVVVEKRVDTRVERAEVVVIVRVGISVTIEDSVEVIVEVALMAGRGPGGGRGERTMKSIGPEHRQSPNSLNYVITALFPRPVTLLSASQRPENCCTRAWLS